MAEEAIPGIYNLTSPVVMTFPNLLVPRAFGQKGKESGEPKYSANFSFAPDSADLKQMKAVAARVARAAWPSIDFKALSFPFSNGDEMADNAKAAKKDREYYRGHVVVAARSKYAPSLTYCANGVATDYAPDDENRMLLKTKIFGGQVVLAGFKFVAYKGVGRNPDGVTAYLNSVVLSTKGTRVGGGAEAPSVTFKGHIGQFTDEDPTRNSLETIDDEIPF